MDIKKRNQPGSSVQDPSAISMLQYNNAAGAIKTSEQGQHLLPLPVPGVGVGYTTDVSSAAYPLPGAGKNLAVYNNSNGVLSLTFGSDGTVASLAVGIADANGNVGLPCPANSWSFFASGYNSWVISSSANLLVFLINDETNITVQAPAFVNSNDQPGSPS